MSTTPDPAAILMQCRFFNGLSREPLERLATMARRLTYPKGRMIFRQDEPCPGLFVGGTGSVKIYKLAPSGKEHVLHFAQPGQTFAEVAAIGRFDCPAYAEAIEDTMCLLLPREPFVRALETDHQLCLQLLGSMSLWVRQLVGLLEDLVLRDATGRVARHLLASQKGSQGNSFRLPMLKKDLGSHLNLTSETVSRTFRRLMDSGLIEAPDAQHIRILDPEALADVAEGLLPAEFD